MSTEKNAKNFIVVIDQEKIEPDLAKETVIKYDPLNRSGKEGGFRLDDEGHLHIDNENVMEAHKMAINKYPYDGAIQLIRLDREFGEKIHQYGENAFRLYGLPEPKEGRVTGILGRNGIGKSTALRILAGDIKPNLGQFEEEPDWSEIKKEYRGTGLQTHFNKLAEGEVTSAFKPQQVDKIPEYHEGTVEDLLEIEDERDVIGEVAEKTDISHLMDRELDELSGGELQRVAIASTMVKDADLYMFDEPSSFLDVKQRLNIGEAIHALSEDAAVLVVEHDLATLDLVSDAVHVFHGEAGAYGMVSNAFSTREGINQYLDGYLKTHNLQIRSESIDFKRTKRSQVEKKASVFEYPELAKSFGQGKFSLEVDSGVLHEEEVLGIFGENGLGKTTFAKMLAGALEPDQGQSPEVDLSFKPQYLESQDANVEAVISQHVNPENKKFKNRIAEPLGIEDLYEQNINDLSGGELQKVGVAICLSRNADVYVLDEPSAYLDVESRVELGRVIKRFARKTEKPVMVIDHDLILLDYISDRGLVFEGEPGVEGYADNPSKIGEAMNKFLKLVDLTFRKDPETGRPRANKPGSQKDKQQRKKDEFYEQKAVKKE
ncbi:ribosome biogenesis/translation initiation ATPase RLI [Candidatus Nanohaloarchaea archaeon]|nr:ribosome biogenesis/translation initiation ATPase RLI [Candidatus Nanohaloarchaea archaeon]